MGGEKCSIKEDVVFVFSRLFLNEFFAPNLVNYLWRHQAPMKNDITTKKPTSKIQDKLQILPARIEDFKTKPQKTLRFNFSTHNTEVNIRLLAETSLLFWSDTLSYAIVHVPVES
jgi:hypothetical protein